MGLEYASRPRSLKDTPRGKTTQKLLYGIILLVIGMGLIVVTTSMPTLLPMHNGADSLTPVIKVTRFLIGAGFIAISMVLFALATETSDKEIDSADNLYSSYSYNT